MHWKNSAVVLLFLAAACHQKQGPGSQAMVVVDARTGAKADALHNQMDSLILTYYRLKDDLVKWDTSSADVSAQDLDSAEARIPVGMIMDSSRSQRVRATLAGLQGEIEGFIGENSDKGKMEEFEMISDITYDLVRTVGLKNQTVYRDFCPMAFHNRGAYWLSNRQAIENPYMSRSMPDCGQIRETMKY